MAEAVSSVPSPAPRRRGVWWRVLLLLLAILVVLVVALFFVATSSEFFKKRVLPRVSEAIHAQVTVSSAEIHPFSSVVLHDLKVQPTNQPTLLLAREVRVKYSLMDIIGGNIHVDEMAMVSPTIQVVENADGSSNLDPLTQKNPKAESGKAEGGSGGKPLRLDVRRVSISNGSVLLIQNQKVGTRDLMELTNVDVTVSGVKNGEAGKVELAAIVRVENNPPAPAMYGLLEAKVDGTFNFSLTGDLKPSSVLGDAHLAISHAGGAYADFAQLNGVLHCDLQPKEIKVVSLSFEKDRVALGELRASGPFDAEKSEGRLSVELLSVDKQVLNLFGAKSGLDFGSTKITLTNSVELAKGGKAISAVGQMDASQFQVSRTNVSTPPLDLRADYNVSFDKTEKRALLQTMNFSGTQKGRQLMRAELTSPMTLTWGTNASGMGDSALTFAVTKLNLADWKAFIGDLAPAGTVDMNAKLLSQRGGEQVTFEVTNVIQNLTANAGGERLSEATVALRARGVSTNLKQFSLSDFGLQVGRSNQTAIALSGAGTYDRKSADADLQVTGHVTIGRLMQLMGMTNGVSSGTAEMKARVVQKGETQSVTGNLAVTNLTGNVGGSAFTNFGAAVAFDVNKAAEEIEIRKASGSLAEGKNPGGKFDLSGNYSLANKPSLVTVKLADFNENGLRPFVGAALGGKKLVSVTLAGDVSVQLGAGGDTAVKANLQVTNLVVAEAGQKTNAPLEAKVVLDAEVAKQVADLRQLQVALTPTERAKNQFQVQGKVDMSKTNAIQGSVTLTADTLDLTRYYDLFGGTNAPAKVSAKAQTNAVAAASPASSSAMTNQLPVKSFTVEASVKEFYLREIAATNLHAVVQADATHVHVKPVQLVLNGSPVRATADVDLSVPGYKYALTFYMTNALFAPLWNTFKPEAKGQVGGTLTALVDIGGTGTTGESLQKTLTGTFDLGTTNLNLDVSKIRTPILGDIVAVVAKVPELFGENPVQAASGLAMGAVGRVFGKYSGGLADDVSRSPIEVITMRGGAGNGKVTVEQAIVRSTVFEADVTNGTVTLAPVLTNSTINLPIGISITRPMVAKLLPQLISSDTPTNAAYIRLPDFYVEKGTIGEPKPSLNTVALGKSVVQKFVPGLTGTNGAVGNILQGVGGLFQKGGGNTNAPAGTNEPPATNAAPSTNATPINNLMNRFLGK